MTLEVNNLDWLTRNSPLVFVGRLRARTAEKDAKGLFVTRNRFDIERVIAGSFADKTITLSVLGGTVGGETLKVSHMPVFTVDRRYMVFTDASRTTYNPITGNEHGVFLVIDDRVYTSDGRAVLGVDGGVLRTGTVVQRGVDPPATGERPSGQVDNPKTSGAVVSAQRASEAAEAPMPLEEFSRAVAAAARR
jgi:hypothetical protein